jgi:hypothetical protein
MISTIGILFVTAIVLSLVMILKLILTFHEKGGMVELDIRKNGERGPL